MIPLQDVLELGSEARMNTPGSCTATGRWRLEPGQLTDEHAARLRAATVAAGRYGPERGSGRSLATVRRAAGAARR